MNTPLVTNDTNTGELRSNPKGFASAQDYVTAMVWEKRKSDLVQLGDTLSITQWGSGKRGVLCVPEGCSGHVSDLNKLIFLEELEYEPSQYIARFAQE